MSQRNLGEAAVPQPPFAGLWRAIRSARRTAAEATATGVALRAIIGSRLIIWGFGLGALAIFGKNVVSVGMNDPFRFTEPFRAASANLLFAPTARWDSVWYLDIARAGYFSRTSSSYFPLYPLLMHAGATVFGSYLVVGVLISIGSALVALYLLYLLARLDLSEQAARTTVLLVAFFPTAFFLSAVYTEALFLMLTVGAVYAARRDRWLIASLLGGLAASSRSAGVLIAVPLAFMYFYGPRGARPNSVAAWWRPRYRFSRSSLWLLLIPAGLAAYLGYLWITHDAPLAPFQQEFHWRRSFAGPFGAIVVLFKMLPHDLRLILGGNTNQVLPGDPLSWNTHDLIDLGFLVFAAVGLVWSWRRVPLAYFLYAVVALAQSLAYPSSVEPLASFPRYMLVIFPLFMGWAAKLSDKPIARRTTLLVSSALLAVFSGIWAYWGWIA